MEQILDLALELLKGILIKVITIETVIVVSSVIFLTEIIKQFGKSKIGKKWKVGPLENWEIRGISVLLGVVLTLLIMDSSYKVKILWGIFNGGMTSVVYWILKKYGYGLKKFMIDKKLSGQ